MKKIIILVMGGNEQYVRDILYNKGFKAHKTVSLVVEPMKHGPAELSSADIAELMRTRSVVAVIDGDL